MADLKDLSDDELRAAYERSRAGNGPVDLSKLSDDELKAAYAGSRVTADNVVRSIAHGVPVIGGLADKIAAGGDALLGPLVDSLSANFGFGPNASGTSRADSIGQRYRENLAREQAHSGAYAAQHPAANTAGELAGGVAGAGAMLPAAPLLSVPSIVGGAAIGGADALTRGGDLGDAATGAAIGGALPGALGMAGRAIGKVLPLAASLSSGMSVAEQAAAREAGRLGGRPAQVFLDNAKSPDTDALVGMARQGIEDMRQDMLAGYRADKRLWSQGQNLPFAPVVQDVNNAFARTVSPRGVVMDDAANAALTSVKAKVADFIKANGQTASAEEMDALKRAVGAIRDELRPGSNAYSAVDNVYDGIHGLIANHAPGYAAAMQGYAQAYKQLQEVTKALSLGDKAAAATAMSKLMSTMKDGYTGAHGARATALSKLSGYAPDMRYAIAGQAANNIMPRGLVARLLAGHGVGAGVLTAFHPGAVAALPLASPRVVGLGNYAAGRIGQALPPALPAVAGAQSAVQANTNQNNANQPATYRGLFDEILNQ